MRHFTEFQSICHSIGSTGVFVGMGEEEGDEDGIELDFAEGWWLFVIDGIADNEG